MFPPTFPSFVSDSLPEIGHDHKSLLPATVFNKRNDVLLRCHSPWCSAEKRMLSLAESYSVLVCGEKLWPVPEQFCVRR